jgi:hypothetical protein
LNSVEENIVEMLAYIYSVIPWSKIKTRHNAYDIFNHRVRAASRRATIGQFLSKLCNYFGMQQAPIEAIAIMNLLKFDEKEALNLIYSEHIAIAMKAIIRAKEMKNIKDKNQTKLFGS